MIWFAITLLVILGDQVSKYFVVENLKNSESVTIIDNFFYFTFINNKGAAFGMFQNAIIFFIPLTIIVGIVIAYFIIKSKSKFLSLSLSFVLGGAIGNLIDRIFRQDGVIDFLHFKFGKFSFWIFNLADSFVVIGTILLTIYIIFIYKDEEIQLDEKIQADEKIQ